jgi:hypothetical protein
MNASLGILRPLLLVCASLTATILALAADERTPVVVKFSDPARPGTLKAELPWSNLKIRGTDAPDVQILSTVASKEKAAKSPNGLRRLDDETSFTAVEKDNVITLSLSGATNWNAHGAKFEVQVPRNTALVLRSGAGGDVTVENVDGDIDINTMNGEVRLRDIAGSAVVNSMSGEINAAYRTAPQKPVSLSSMNGEVSLRLPADTKANVRLRTHNGAVYTDFDDKAMVTKTEGSTGRSTGHLPPETARAISEATREASRAAHEAVRVAAEIGREVAQEVRRAVAEAKAAKEAGEATEVKSTGEAPEAPKPPTPPKTPKAPRAPRPPVFTGSSITGGKTVTGTLNGGGPDISISTMNGTITIRQAK